MVVDWHLESCDHSHCPALNRHGYRDRGHIFCVLSPADWLSIDVPRYAYEGDRVVVRCYGEDNGKIRKLKYYKNGELISTYDDASRYIISNAKTSDSGSYYCKTERQKFWFIYVTEESSSARLTVGGECLQGDGRQFALEADPDSRRVGERRVAQHPHIKVMCPAQWDWEGSFILL